MSCVLGPGYSRWKRAACAAVPVVMWLWIFLPICFAQHTTPKFLPPDNKILLFIGQDRESIDAYSRELNTVPAGVMFYTSIQTLSGIDTPADHGAGFQDAAYLLREYPASALQIGLYMVDALAGILDGKYDDNIERLGHWLMQIERPVYLRIGYEFDLPQNRYDPALYRKAFRLLVSKWRSMGVRNVAYVWHSYGVMNPEKSVMQWYPGDSFVDWLGVSFFNLYNVNDFAVFARLASELEKPLMIAEASPSKSDPQDGRQKWERWYKRLFEFAKKHNVRAICYINCNWEQFPMWDGQSWGDSRVETDPFLKDAWLQEIHSPEYLQSSPNLFKSLGL